MTQLSIINLLAQKVQPQKQVTNDETQSYKGYETATYKMWAYTKEDKKHELVQTKGLQDVEMMKGYAKEYGRDAETLRKTFTTLIKREIETTPFEIVEYNPDKWLRDQMPEKLVNLLNDLNNIGSKIRYELTVHKDNDGIMYIDCTWKKIMPKKQ